MIRAIERVSRICSSTSWPTRARLRPGVIRPDEEARLRAEVAALYRRARGGEDVAAALEAAEIAAARLAIPNELKAVWGALGGRGLNASTSHDRTEYRVDVPASQFEAWARLEADRFSEPAFRTFGTELGTVLEEIARSADDPNRAGWAMLRTMLFGDHPYGTPVLGAAEHVAGATPDDAEAFFRAGHGARNLVVCLAGDLDPRVALPLLERTLGRLPEGLPRSVRWAHRPRSSGSTGRRCSMRPSRRCGSRGVAWGPVIPTIRHCSSRTCCSTTAPVDSCQDVWSTRIGPAQPARCG